MSDIRFNTWLHQSGTGGITQVDGGHVGIGTTNPDIAVHTANVKKVNVGIVTANSVYAGNFYGDGSNLTGTGHVDKIIEGDTKVEVFDAGSQYISAEVNGGEKLRIDSTGKLLIGTTTEGNATGDDLTISNAGNMGLTLRSTNSSYCNIYFSDATSGTAEYEGYISYNHGTDSLEFATVHTERLRITSSGALGTNTTVRSANGGLDLCAQGATNLGTLTLGAGGGQNGQSRSSNQENQFRIMMPTYADPSLMTTVFYGTSGTAGHDLFYGGGTGWAYATNTHRFFTTANQTTGTGTERIRILSNGHVAIGHDIANDTGMFKVIAADGQSDDQYVGQFKNLEATEHRNWGLLVQAGSSSTDESLRVRNSANNRDHLLIRGDGVKVTQSRGGNYAKTFEFNYNDGAPGGQQTKSLATISTYSDTTSAVAEVTYVGVYGTANNYISSSKWICAVRRGNNNSVWNQTAAETAVGGNTNTSSLDIYWSNGQLYAQTVGPWMGWTVNVRLTILNGDITVNV